MLFWRAFCWNGTEKFPRNICFFSVSGVTAEATVSRLREIKSAKEYTKP